MAVEKIFVITVFASLKRTDGPFVQLGRNFDEKPVRNKAIHPCCRMSFQIFDLGLDFRTSGVETSNEILIAAVIQHGKTRQR
jgi:hypothetical protein